MADTYYYGQGKIEAAPLINGVLGKYRFIGDVSAFSVALAVEKVEHKESYSGQKALVRSFPVGKSATVNLTLRSIEADNLALVLYGKVIDTPAGTVTDELLPDGLASGDVIRLAHMGASNVVLKQGSGQTVAADKFKLLDNGAYGEVQILDASGLSAPLKANYQHAKRRDVGMFTAPQPTVALRYKGVNLAEGSAPVLIELYKVATDPLAELPLISDGTEIAGLSITGGVLLDASKPSSGALGQFGQFSQLA